MAPTRDADDLDALYFALAAEPRRRILDALKAQPGCNLTHVCEAFEGELSRFGVMKHLNTLEAAGLVITERRGRDKLLWFNAAPIQWIYERWTTEYSAYWAARLTRLKYDSEGAHVLPFPAPRTKGRNRG